MSANTVKERVDGVLAVFGKNVQRVREKRRYSYLELAMISGYDRQYLSMIETEGKDIQLSTSIKIARALDVPLNILFSREFDRVSTEEESTFTDNDFLLIFGSNVKRHLDAINKKEIYIYTQTGIDPATINRILNQRTIDPRISSLTKIAAGIEKELSILLSRA